MIRSNLEPVVDAPSRRSDRVSHQPDRYYNFLIQNGDPIELDENNKDSITNMDVIWRSDSDKWFEAMKFKIKFMKVNDMWTLVDPLEGIKFIGCK